MRPIYRIHSDCLPAPVRRDLEKQGLGWGHTGFPGAFWIAGDKKKGR